MSHLGEQRAASDEGRAPSAAAATSLPADAATRDRRAILHARARELAREPRAEVAAAASIEVVEFLLGAERYAVESTTVREVYPLRELTPLPCTPAFVLGIVNVRGQVLAVIDLRRFFELPPRGLTELNKVIILRTPEMQLGLLADAILGVRSVPLEELQSPPPTLTGVRAEFLRGVTSDGLAVLDAEGILGDERIIVREEL